MDETYDEADLVDGLEVQRPQDEQFNDFGKSQNFSIQLNYLDLTEEEELAWTEIVDPDDMVEAAPLIEEAAQGEEAVPFDWQYWEHDENTLPPVDESGAPPLPSGWIDPVTGEEIP